MQSMSTLSVMFVTVVLALLATACSVNQCQSDSCNSVTPATTPSDVSYDDKTVDDSTEGAETVTTFKTRAAKNNPSISTSEIQAEEDPKILAVSSVINAERVHSIAYDGVAVMAKVISTGCTSDEHFEVYQEVRDGSCYLTLMRNKPDYCRRAPFVMDVSVPWTLTEDCSTLPVVFGNELIDSHEESTAPSSQRQLTKD